MMRSSILVAACLLVAVAWGKGELPEFIPCSFHAEFHTRVMNTDREIIATSVDQFYYDHDDLWRWDSDFNGIPPLIDPQQWVIIWRPDLTTAFHDFGDKCILNYAGKPMTPLPYDWFVAHTSGVNWFKLTGTWEDMPVFIYHTTFYVERFKVTFTADIFILQEDDSLVLINGTAKGNGLDVTYTMDAVVYEHRTHLSPNLFIPSARCSYGQVIPAPSEPSDEFQKQCYVKDAASRVSAFGAALLMVLLAVMLI